MSLVELVEMSGGFDLRSNPNHSSFWVGFLRLGVDALRLVLGWPGMAKGAPKSFGMGWNAQGCP